MRNLLIAGLVVVSMCIPANGREGTLADFEGTWAPVNLPEPNFSFTRIGESIQVSLPQLGHAEITESRGEKGSNFKVSGEGFSCFYAISILEEGTTWEFEAGKGVTWEFKAGDDVCPKFVHLKRTADRRSNARAEEKAPATLDTGADLVASDQLHASGSVFWGAGFSDVEVSSAPKATGTTEPAPDKQENAAYGRPKGRHRMRPTQSESTAFTREEAEAARELARENRGASASAQDNRAGGIADYPRFPWPPLSHRVAILCAPLY